MSSNHWLLSSGVVASVGAIVGAAVQGLSGRAESRAKAADLIAGAAGGLADRLSALNEKLEADNSRLRSAVLSLVDAVTVVLASADMPDEVASQARRALGEAKQHL